MFLPVPFLSFTGISRQPHRFARNLRHRCYVEFLFLTINANNTQWFCNLYKCCAESLANYKHWFSLLGRTSWIKRRFFTDIEPAGRSLTICHTEPYAESCQRLNAVPFQCSLYNAVLAHILGSNKLILEKDKITQLKAYAWSESFLPMDTPHRPFYDDQRQSLSITSSFQTGKWNLYTCLFIYIRTSIHVSLYINI